MELNRIYCGDNRQVLKDWPESCVDAVVTDPPYELGFMGKSWDSTGIAYDVEMWRGVLRVMKPGAHLLAFGGTRTYHRMACAIEDAGFEIRDQLQWLYGSGFPKSLDVSKAIDKTGGHWRVRANGLKSGNGAMAGPNYERTDKGEPILDAAKSWSGWGTALKPANEPICLARKPLSEKTVAANVLKWGTGALNIDGTRIWTSEECARKRSEVDQDSPAGFGKGIAMGGNGSPLGRWPSNVLLDEEAARMLDEQSGLSASSEPLGRRGGKEAGILGAFEGQEEVLMGHTDQGGASRFFYVAKADRAERDENLETWDERIPGLLSRQSGQESARRNFHPTVKPILLMQYLVRLVLPKGGVCLDPFLGSGTTAKACRGLGVSWVGVELDPEHVRIAEGRISGELF